MPHRSLSWLRPVLVLSLVALGLVAASGAVPGGVVPAVSPQVADTFLRMRVFSAVLEAEESEGRGLPGPTPGLVDASWLRKRVSPRHRADLEPGKDAWGAPLLYWSDGRRHHMVISLGKDGRAEFDYTGERPFEHIPRATVGQDPAADLVVVDGQPWRGPFSPTTTVLRSFADLRAVGTACESYSIDTNLYPGPVLPIAPAALLAPDLEPVYIRNMPRADPWGHPYLYVSDGRSYAFVGVGVDGTPDSDYAAWTLADFESVSPMATTDSEADLIWVNGRFLRWPMITEP